MVKQIESKSAFQEALNSAGEKLVVVDFSATWCGPCKMIKPFFHSLSEKYSNVVFLEVDVDDCQISPELTNICASLPLLYMWDASAAWPMSGVGLRPGSEPANQGRRSRTCGTLTTRPRAWPTHTK
uniref:Thioredoxin n=1 Tax=Equus caballus TaxID=9796 RepID=A0A9R8N1B8_HORSE